MAILPISFKNTRENHPGIFYRKRTRFTTPKSISMGMINISGPNARQVLEKVADTALSNDAFPFGGYREFRVHETFVALDWLARLVTHILRQGRTTCPVLRVLFKQVTGNAQKNLRLTTRCLH